VPFDQRICSNCIRDEYLKHAIEQGIGEVDECFYCNASAPTISIWNLAERCDAVIDFFFEVSSLTMGVVHFDRTPEGDDLSTVLHKLTGLDGVALEDLHETLSEKWFDHNTQEEKYGEDPWFVESSETTAQISFEWEQMERSLRDTARLFNPAAANLLEKIFGPVMEDRTHGGHSVVIRVGPGHPISSLFRAREFETLQELQEAFEHPESRLGPPPVGSGRAGRMNCAGIPVFYGATKTSTAISEVRPAVGANVAVASFKIIRELNLLDLSNLGALSIPPEASKFSPITVERATRRNFLRTLIDRLTTPVLPGLANNDYLITQAIADFLATHTNLNLHGILFPSTQDAIKDSMTKNVVLFRKASTVLRSELEYRDTASVYLMEYDENSAWLAPTIESRPLAEDEQQIFMYHGDGERFEPTLELDRNHITIHEIKAVEYRTLETRVAHTFKAPSEKKP
jgi:hypothetical protein